MLVQGPMEAYKREKAIFYGRGGDKKKITNYQEEVNHASISLAPTLLDSRQTRSEAPKNLRVHERDTHK